MNAKVLRQIRKSKEMSQMALSKRSGVGRNRISMAECNYVVLTQIETMKIKKALGLSKMKEV